MFTRRNLLKIGAAAAGASLVPESLIAADTTAEDLPPSIAKLESMRSLAKPITREERGARLEKARQLMAQNKLDAIMVGGGTSLVYFTGIHWWTSERMFVMVLPAKGAPFFVCPGFEEDRAMEQITAGPFAGTPDIRIWQEDESPYQRVLQGLKDRGIAAGNIGVEERMGFVFADGVAQVAPQARMVSATPVTAGCRMVKSPHEIDLMRLAAHVTLQAYASAYRAIFESKKEGITQNQFAAWVAAAHDKLGFPGDAGVQVGEYSALPHGSIQPQALREGSILLMDGGCSVEGYVSDISRTFVIGKPTDKMKKVFDIVHRAQTVALAAAKPGVECGAVDAAARKVITDAGFGPDYKYFSHRVGHGMGMDGHEWPYLVRGNKLALVPHMTFSDEPGIYIRGEFGVRLEDDMHITENGSELFTPQSESLEKPF